LDVQSAIERSSNVALSYRIHARMLTDAMDYDKAIVALERVGELEPYDRSLPLQRANWWRKRNEWKKARFELNGWLDFAPNDAEYLEQLGDVQRHLSEDASAIRAWFDAMRCDPVRVERIMGKLLEPTEPSESWFRTVIEQGNRWLSKNESERKSREMKLHQVLTERDIPLRIQRLRSIVSEFGESIKNAPSEK